MMHLVNCLRLVLDCELPIEKVKIVVYTRENSRVSIHGHMNLPSWGGRHVPCFTNNKLLKGSTHSYNFLAVPVKSTIMF